MRRRLNVRSRGPSQRSEGTFAVRKRVGTKAGAGTLAAAGLMVWVSAAWAADPIIEKLEHGEINWTDKTVVATGSGAPDLKLKNVAQVRLAAERAAKVDAYRNIVEALKGVKITAEKTGQSALADRQVRTQVEGILRQCKTVDTRYYSDGGVDVVLRCSLDGGLGITLAPSREQKVVKKGGEATYSGLIVDAAGTKLQPALAPRVLDDAGKEIYASSMVGPSFLRRHGAVAFARTVQEAKENARVGKKPLVIRAAALSDVPSEVQISAEDAQKIAGVDQTFLAEARVVIVTDGP